MLAEGVGGAMAGPDRDCLVSYKLAAGSSVASVSFQSPAMGSTFARFPRALLVHRAARPAGRALYVFLAAEPAPALRGGMDRVVHLAMPRDESAGGLAHMYGMFKALNPAWAETRLLLVGPSFPEPPVLGQAFPAAALRPSVFHLFQNLQQQIQRLALERRAEQQVLAALGHAVCAGTESSRREVLTLLQDLVAPELLPQLSTHWLLDQELWATHRERTWGKSSSYVKDLELVTQGLSGVLSAELSLESCFTSLSQHYQKCTSESPPDAEMCSAPCPDHRPAWGLPLAPLPCQGQPSQSPVQACTQQQASPAGTHSPVSVLQSPPAATQLPTAHQPQPGAPQALLLWDEPASSQSSPDPSSPAVKLEATASPGGDSEEEITRRAEECIRRSLSEVCTEPAARLCLSEFAVVQESVQLIGAEEDAFSVQVLEDAQSVDPKGPSSCTCHFSQTFQLPCRHLLAVLSSERKTLQPEMLHRRWQKERGTHQAGRDAADSGLLEILESSWSESLDRSLLVSFLAAEVSRLLTHCSEEEFERRYRTLRELADSWIGPYVAVKL